MHNTVTCPACHTEFDLDLAMSAKLEESIKLQYESKNKLLAEQFQQKELQLKKMQEEFEEKKRKENEIVLERVRKETEANKKLIEEQLRKDMALANQHKMDFFEKQLQEKELQLKGLQQKELEILQLHKQLQDQKELQEFNLQKQRLDIEAELKTKLSNEILVRAQEKFDLEKRELEKQLNDQKRLTEQMTRKLEQGSMQTQGEVQEIKLEELLQQTFPFDLVTEVGKGKRGADCMLIIRNEIGQESGKIIFESKRTKDYKKEWLAKLKEDAVESNADLSVLVTQVMPDDIKLFDQREGVWICGMAEVISLVKALREGILNVARAKKFNENKGEKKEMLYQYFTGNEFMQQMRAINEAYLYLKSSIDKERFQMEKIWKEREKQIDKVLLNNTYLIGTIKGIAGNDVEDHFLE